MKETQPSSGPEATRKALAMAALKLFGQQGFDGTSTREIAAEAKANIGSIAYHFGGKDGLRTAAADLIVEMIQTIAGPVLGKLDAESAPAGRDEAEAQLYAAVDRMVSFMVARPEAGDIVQFVLRELARPTEALDRIYDGLFEPLHRRLCLIWQRATDDEAEADATKLTVFTMIGQVIYFRIGREAVLRRMGWAEIGTAESAQIVDAVRTNLTAILAARKGKPA
nr:CerR family C-terminal domain-containing protein [Oryzicola mucosus]